MYILSQSRASIARTKLHFKSAIFNFSLKCETTLIFQFQVQCSYTFRSVKKCTLHFATRSALETGKSKWFCTCSAFALENFCALCTSPLALNVHFRSVLRLCTFGKLTLSRPVHFCKAFMFALLCTFAFCALCTFALSRVCSIVHFGNIVRLCGCANSHFHVLCTFAQLLELVCLHFLHFVRFCAFALSKLFSRRACALISHFVDFRARAQVQCACTLYTFQ